MSAYMECVAFEVHKRKSYLMFPKVHFVLINTPTPPPRLIYLGEPQNNNAKNAGFKTYSEVIEISSRKNHTSVDSINVGVVMIVFRRWDFINVGVILNMKSTLR